LTNTIQNIEWKIINLEKPQYFYNKIRSELFDENQANFPLTDMFYKYSIGIVTARDNLCISPTKTEILARLKQFISLSENDAREKFSLGKDARDWKVAFAQKDVVMNGILDNSIKEIAYRPFDTRYTYYSGVSRDFLCMPRPEVMKNMLIGMNIGLVARRQMIGKDNNYFFSTDKLMSDGYIRSDNKGGESLFPLYLYFSHEKKQDTLFEQIETNRQPNLTRVFISAFSIKLGLSFIEDGQGDLASTFGPEDVFYYTYAVFHSPTYRSRYAEFLKIDFPRLPLTTNLPLFRTLVRLGKELVDFHLLRTPRVDQFITGYPIAGDHLVEKVQYANRNVWINPKQYFEGVPEEVWNFKIGGYQVCDKWLKDRKGRKLTGEDINHYQRVVVALNETIRLMAEVDAAIPAWPME
jgi:predicted helicase